MNILDDLKFQMLVESASADRIGRAIAKLNKESEKKVNLKNFLSELFYHLSYLRRANFKADSKLAKKLEGDIGKTMGLMKKYDVDIPDLPMTNNRN